MANIQAGDRVQVTLNVTGFNQRMMSTFVYGLSTITGVATQAAALAALHTKLTAYDELVYRYRAALCPEFEVTEAWYQVISPSRYAKYTFTSGLGVGTFALGTALSPNQAAVILRRGDFGNRHNVSTLHFPIGQNAGCQANGGIGADIETPLTSLAAKMLELPSTTGVVAQWVPVINNGVNAPDYTPIVATALKTTVRVMRRRTVGLGI